MDCQCIVEARRLYPGVFNLKQYLNQTEQMVWKLTNTKIKSGERDLCDYDAYLSLCVGGQIDEIKLAKQMDSDTLKLIWDVGTYATALKEHVKYQISFRSTVADTLGVIGATDTEANGNYALTLAYAEGTARVWENTASGYLIQYDSTNTRWTIYAADGTTVIDYQRFPHSEPFGGVWNEVLCGNNTAAVWVSDEAIMTISESIAADEHITGNFPTILRQMWDSVQSMILNAGCVSKNITFTEEDWVGDSAPYSFVISAETTAGALMSGCIVYKSTSEGMTRIDNLEIGESASGNVTIQSLEKFSGEAILILAVSE